MKNVNTYTFILQEPPIIPVTFLTPGSHAKLRGYENNPSMNVSFSFRTYEPNGLLLYHKFNSEGYVKVCRFFSIKFLLFPKTFLFN